MQINIKSVQELGLLIRATRKHQKLRMDDVAGSAGVGPVFVRELERGKKTVQFGRVMQILAELGIELSANVSEDCLTAFAKLKHTGVKPLKTRKRKAEVKISTDHPSAAAETPDSPSVPTAT